MGRVKEASPIFQKENYFGVLTHDGSFKVAKTEIKQKILHINKDKNGKILDILVKGRKGSYVTDIHKGIRKMLLFVEKGDYAYVKFKNGKAWFVGFQKEKAYRQQYLHERYLDEDNNCDWNAFMKGV